MKPKQAKLCILLLLLAASVLSEEFLLTFLETVQKFSFFAVVRHVQHVTVAADNVAGGVELEFFLGKETALQ